MERIKKAAVEPVLILPGTNGWLVRGLGGVTAVATLEEAAEKCAQNPQLLLALPVDSVLVERVQLPATEESEIGDMLALQLEKSLPYELHEVSRGFNVVEKSESQSAVLSMAVPHQQLESLCEPFRKRGQLPQHIFVYAQERAAASQATVGDATALLLWIEQGLIVAAIAEAGRLLWTRVLCPADEPLLDAVEAALLSAEMDGIEVAIRTCLLQSADLAPHAKSLRSLLGCPVESEPVAEETDGAAPQTPQSVHPATAGYVELLPAQWREESARLEKDEKIKQALTIGGFVYLLLVAGAFGYLAWLKHSTSVLINEAAALKPKMALIDQHKTRWETFAHAIHPELYPAEVLHQICEHARVDGLQLTQFEFSRREWVLKGEAASPAVAQGLASALKGDKELSERAGGYYKIDDSTPPVMLKDERVAFTITGKPQVKFLVE